jgi:hypothetical protein
MNFDNTLLMTSSSMNFELIFVLLHYSLYDNAEMDPHSLPSGFALI